MSLLEQDDIHTIGTEPWWREAWYFEFYDPRTEIAVKSYAGVHPNQERADLIFHVNRSGKTAHKTMKMDYRIARDLGRERLSFGPQLLEMIEPGEKWRIRFMSEEVNVDVTFEATQSLFTWAEAGLGMEAEEVPSKHFDQPGRYTGWVEIEGERFEVDTIGMRDRMWGWGGRKDWMNYLIMWAPFSEDFMLNVACHQFLDGHTEVAGFVFKDGERALLESAELEVRWRQDRWKEIEVVHSTLVDAAGRTLEMTSRPDVAVIDTAGHWAHRVDHMLFATGRHEADGQTMSSCINWAFYKYDERPDGFSARRKENLAVGSG